VYCPHQRQSPSCHNLRAIIVPIHHIIAHWLYRLWRAVADGQLSTTDQRGQSMIDRWRVDSDHTQRNDRITVWTVVQTVLTATFNSYGNRQISTPHKINNPEPTSYTKFGRNPFTGSFWANGWNITKIIFIYLFIYTFFLWSAYRSDPWMDFYAR